MKNRSVSPFCRLLSSSSAMYTLAYDLVLGIASISVHPVQVAPSCWRLLSDSLCRHGWTTSTLANEVEVNQYFRYSTSHPILTMAHTLPQRPSFLPAPPEPSISLALEADLDLLAAPVPSSSTSTSCSICASPPKYTCPGCSRKSCSLTCSKTHKEKFQCDGKRDITAYVPLKEVNEGVWSDDYRWLEESRRKVAQWGETLPPGAAAQMQIGDQRGNKRQNFKRKRGGGNGGGAQGVLEGELEKRGIMVEFMPDGMDRRKKNQSSYNIQ